MARVTIGDAPATKTPPGVYLCEIRKATEKTSGKGNLMFDLTWKGVHVGDLTVYDNIMLSGKGKFLGDSRLEALGWPPKFNGEINASELIGKRAWLFLAVETFQGKASLRTDIGQGTHCGYQPEDDPPPEATHDAPHKSAIDYIVEDENTPF